MEALAGAIEQRRQIEIDYRAETFGASYNRNCWVGSACDDFDKIGAQLAPVGRADDHQGVERLFRIIYVAKDGRSVGSVLSDDEAPRVSKASLRIDGLKSRCGQRSVAAKRRRLTATQAAWI